ncbi:MAG: hypothetical protein CL693_10390 [Cellvibrionaceae bacterium]|nr:hypothetical protein [Cellvibrionaceae bacterium]|tara:strand:- start:6804 stop:7235 length:432 start_codon:yes stop_codon:yes gene_type:complete
MNQSSKTVLLAAACLLIILSSAATVVVMNSLSDGRSVRAEGELPLRRYDLFESYDECEADVKKAVVGHVVSLVSDDRAARYDESSNTNKLFFLADVAAEDSTGVHLEQGISQIFARCDVSAETNRIEGVYLRRESDPEYVEAD